MLTRLKRAVRHRLLAASGRYGHLRVDVAVNAKWCGNDYGGFYANLDGLSRSSVAYSFGVGEDTSFDEDLIASCGCTVHAFDPTPKSIAWVKSRGDLPPGFHFHPYGISDVSGPATFRLPRNPDHVSGSLVEQDNVTDSRTVTVELKSISDIADELGHKTVDLVKMDIEGAEYLVLDSVLASGLSIRQILVEFHDRLIEDGKAKSEQAVERLRANGFGIFGVSPGFQEVSFIKGAPG